MMKNFNSHRNIIQQKCMWLIRYIIFDLSEIELKRYAKNVVKKIQPDFDFFNPNMSDVLSKVKSNSDTSKNFLHISAINAILFLDCFKY